MTDIDTSIVRRLPETDRPEPRAEAITARHVAAAALDAGLDIDPDSVRHAGHGEWRADGAVVARQSGSHVTIVGTGESPAPRYTPAEALDPARLLREAADRYESGPMLRWAREELGWAQADLADALGTSQQHVGQWESGDRRPTADYREALRDLADAIDQIGRSPAHAARWLDDIEPPAPAELVDWARDRIADAETRVDIADVDIEFDLPEGPGDVAQAEVTLEHTDDGDVVGEVAPIDPDHGPLRAQAETVALDDALALLDG